MRIVDVIARSGRSLRSAKGRTILTALAIAVGGFTLTATLAAGNGIREYTNRLVSSNFDPAELLVGRDPEVSNNSSLNTAPKEYDENSTNFDFGGGGIMSVIMTPESDLEALRGLSYVDRVRPELSLQIKYVTREGQKKYSASAITYNPSQKPETASGELPKTADLNKGEILIPDTYLEVLGFADANDALGKNVEVNYAESLATSAQDVFMQLEQGHTDLSQLENVQPDSQTMTLKVAGVVKKSATSMSFGAQPLILSGADAKAIYDYTSQGTPNYGKYMYAYVHVKDGHDQAKLDAAQSDLKAQGYYVIGSKEIQKSITQIVNVFQILVGVFGLITVVASIFGIVNTQYISVLERTREIGLMKALGMRSRSIRELFMFEAGWIGFIGGVLGALTAFIAGKLLNPWLAKKLDLGNDLLIFRLDQIVLLILFLVIVATLAGYLPARKAAKLDPIEALRTE